MSVSENQGSCARPSHTLHVLQSSNRVLVGSIMLLQEWQGTSCSHSNPTYFDDEGQLPRCDPSVQLPSVPAGFCWSPPPFRCSDTGRGVVACCRPLRPPTHINTTQCGLTAHRPQAWGQQSWIIRRTGLKHLQCDYIWVCTKTYGRVSAFCTPRPSIGFWFPLFSAWYCVNMLS